jgi:hypothetical protein
MRERANRSPCFFDTGVYFGNNARSMDMNRPESVTKIHKNCAEMTRIARIRSLGAAVCLVLTACGSAVNDTDTAAAANARPVFSCGTDGRLVGELYGAIRASLDWDRTVITCEGMPRPEGDGIRLRFAGVSQPGDRAIAIIIAMPDFSLGSENVELPANVTLIEEGNGRFFSTPDLDNCLADISTVVTVDEAIGRYSITGILYCVSPLPEVNGESSVSVPDLAFTGVFDRSSP